MKIKEASYWANAHTKKARMEMPSKCYCEINAFIGHHGCVTLDLLHENEGEIFASITLHSSKVMKELAKLLNATADAQNAQYPEIIQGD